MKRAVSIIPYGFCLRGSALVPDVREQEVVRIIRDERARGTSYVRIARMLTERGFVTRTGKPFGSTAVYSIAKWLEERAAVVTFGGL